MNKIIMFLNIMIKLIFYRKRVLLCNTPVHENLGDHAITIAEYEFLNKYFHDMKVIELPESICTNKKLNILNIFLKENELVFLQGGGFMGDLWPRHEECMHSIIDVFKNKTIVIFPQTCFLVTDNDDYYRYYNSKTNLLMFLRDKASFERINAKITNSCTCYLEPDIVLFLVKKNNVTRDGIGLCLRKDKESAISQEEKKMLLQEIKNINVKKKDLSTLERSPVPPSKRRLYVKEKLNEFSKNELVITDRLHGMIFSVITGTPCIAINNLSSKVQGVYRWIQELDYVVCCRPNEIDENLIRSMMKKSSSSEYSPDLLKREYDRMDKIIIEKWSKKND